MHLLVCFWESDSDLQSQVNRLPSKIDKYRIAMILEGRLKHLSESVVVCGFWLMQQHSSGMISMVTNHPQEIVSKRISRGFVGSRVSRGHFRDVSKSAANK